MKSNYQYLGHRIKAWVNGVPVEDRALQQLKNIAGLPFIHKHVAVMPDVHLGIGATVGSVIATRGAIVPAAVGVDLGCGMMACQLSLKGNQLPDHLGHIRDEIERAVPHGRTNNGDTGDRGAWETPDAAVVSAFTGTLQDGLRKIVERHPKLERDTRRALTQLGTLGTGNHFIEMCLDEQNHVWIMLHSGSRGTGGGIGNYFINRAREEMQRYFIHLPDVDLAYLVEGTTLFNDYIDAIGWAQDYARINRELMMEATLQAISKHLPPFATGLQAVNCHHNYVAQENHFGSNVWVTRKGAVRARENDLGIIPGSMGAKSYIVRGKGDRESFCSCSHGAGRKMSRNQAEKLFTVEDHIAATEGVECRKDVSVIDETPSAYKDIDAVMAAQSDLVEIVHTLKQVLCVKG